MNFIKFTKIRFNRLLLRVEICASFTCGVLLTIFIGLQKSWLTKFPRNARVQFYKFIVFLDFITLQVWSCLHQTFLPLVRIIFQNDWLINWKTFALLRVLYRLLLTVQNGMLLTVGKRLLLALTYRLLLTSDHRVFWLGVNYRGVNHAWMVLAWHAFLIIAIDFVF